MTVGAAKQAGVKPSAWARRVLLTPRALENLCGRSVATDNCLVIVEAIAWGETLREDEGVNRAQFATLEGLVKFSNLESGYLVANEYIAARLAAAIGLPVPPAALVRQEGRLGFMSLYIGKRSEPPPPLVAKWFMKDHGLLAAEIVAFDTWIKNDDRHGRNIGYSRAGKVPPFIYDHDRSLLGIAAGRGVVEMSQKVAEEVSIERRFRK